mgnify:FL=1
MEESGVLFFDPSELLKVYEGLKSRKAEDKAAAVSCLYDRLGPSIFKRLRYQFRKVGEAELQDVVQEAFLKIFTTSSLPAHSEALVSWAYRIAENTCLDLLRKAYRTHEESWPEWKDSADEATAPQCDIGADLPMDSGDLSQAQGGSINRFVEHCVSQGLSVFSKRFPERELAISLALDGSNMKTIALILNRTEPATRQFIYESRKKLAPFIQHCLEALR